MKKLLMFSILTYLLFTINSSAVSQSSDAKNSVNENILMPIWIKYGYQKNFKTIWLYFFNIF